MFTSKIFSITFVAVCVALFTGGAVAQELIANGDFELVTSGTFDSWNYNTTDSVSVFSSPALDGTYSANANYGTGAIWQQVDDGFGLTDFTWELDFATLPFYTGTRSLHVATYFTDPSNLNFGNLDSVRLTQAGEIEFVTGDGWIQTGLFADITPNGGQPMVFDGETPIMNHLQFTGTGYGLESQAVTITLNGNSVSYSASELASKRLSLLNLPPKYFVLPTLVSSADYLVDNVSLTGTPSTVDPSLPKQTGVSLLTNGDFEAVTGETFDAWDYQTAGSAFSAIVPLEGNQSANIDAGVGTISQMVCETGALDFSWELDFATLPYTSGSRSLFLGTFAKDPSVDPATANNVDAIIIDSTGQLKVYNGGGYAATGLYPNLTTDTGTLNVFDGETPTINHLEFTGMGYGTAGQTIEIKLNGESFISKGAVRNLPVKYFAAMGSASANDYLIDNVEFFLGETVPTSLPKQNGASLLANGNFEAATGGAFDSWDYYTSGSAVSATVPVEGSDSANIVAGEGLISQMISETGASEFSWELDFATVPFSSGVRSLHICTYGEDPSVDPYNADNADSIIITSTGELKFHNGSGWISTGLFADMTTDTGELLAFDGETPVMNHLEFNGKGYGTDRQFLELILNGESFVSMGTVNNVAPKYFALVGLVSAADYLVDNVEFFLEGEEEPVAGDANGDGKVDGSDVTILAGNWQKGVNDGLTASWEEGDFNGDGKVDGSDVTILAGNWQYGVEAAAASVPEPSTLVLFVVGLLSGLFVTRRRKV